MIKIKSENCPKNHHCPVMRICPFGAITQKNNYSAPIIDYSKCTSCGKCTRACSRVFVSA